MTDEYDPWDFKTNLTVEDAGCGHGEAIVEGFPMFDSTKEAQEWINKLISMQKLYNELKEAFINQDEYPPLTKWFKAVVKVEDAE